MSTIDCIMFRNESQMLRVRLAEGFADHHVLVEAALSHRGDAKPLHYAENAGEFAPWADRISHVVADLPAGMAPWAREHAQRDAAIPALEALGLADDDVVLIADVDEFPPRGFDFGTAAPAVSFRQRLAMYAVDWLHPEPHVCTVAARWGALRGKSLAAVRDNRHAYPVADGGWHITWLGAEPGQRAKLQVTCHTEMTETSRELLASGRCYREGIHHSGGFRMIPADVDESWPRMIYERKVPATWYRPRLAQ